MRLGVPRQKKILGDLEDRGNKTRRGRNRSERRRRKLWDKIFAVVLVSYPS